MSLRTAARQLNTDIKSVRAQEQASADLKLSDLYKWQRALDVPVTELLAESDEPLSQPVRERAALLKVMKTARSLLESAAPGPHRLLAENLVSQLVDVMPELAAVTPWPSVGHRRSSHDLGRLLEQPVPTSGLSIADSGE
jgi:hypothetical protein